MRFGAFLFLISILLLPCRVYSEAPRVGISIPLTGPGATYGADIKNILVFLNERSGGGAMEFLFEDDKCDPKEAVSIAHKFAEIDKVRAVIGLPCSGTVLAAAPIYERAKTVIVSAGAGAIAITTAGDYIFRARPSDEGAALLLAQFVGQNHKRVGILAEQTEYAQGLASAFTKNISMHAGVKVLREDFLSDSGDYSSALLKLRSQKIDSLLLLTQAERGLLSLLRAVRNLHWEVPLYSSIFPGSSTFLKAAGADANGIVFATLPTRDESLSAEGKSLLAEFESKFGSLNSVDYIFPVTYAAFRSIGDSIQSVDIKGQLYTRHFRGLNGDFSFDSNGDLVGMHYVIKAIRDGKQLTLSSSKN